MRYRIDEIAIGAAVGLFATVLDVVARRVPKQRRAQRQRGYVRQLRAHRAGNLPAS